jgi:hypothetical protein
VTPRGKAKITPALDVMISVANLPDKLPPLVAILGEGNEVQLKALLKSFSKQQLAFLGSVTEQDVFMDRYSTLQSAQKTLRMLAEREDYSFAGLGCLPPAQVNLYLDNGLIAASSAFLNEIIGQHPDSFRQCKMCPNMFFAQRTNSQCCSEKCRKRFNKRNSRNASKNRKEKGFRR